MVIIFLASKSDMEVATEIVKYLKEFGLDYKIHIASAHKTPEYLLKLIKSYESLKKALVYICVAGRSNALGGFVDAQTVYPVINCPPPSDQYAGLDILSSLRMPSGVAALTILEPEQAALAAAKILGIKGKVSKYQEKLKERIIHADGQLSKIKL